MNTSFVNKKALVVGGTSGIGSYVAQALLQEGAFVTIQGKNSCTQQQRCGETSHSETIICNLDSTTELDILIEKARTVDILCVAYGPFLQKPLDAVTVDEWTHTVYANLTLPGILVSTAIAHMKQEKWGRILLFGGTETHVLRGFKTNAVYGAAKTGIMSLIRSISMSYAPFGITANAICPGFTDTLRLTPEQRALWSKKNPDGVLLAPDSIASAALFLLKNAAYNGVLLPVDKGWSSFTDT
ncbi:MAG: SDR family NAD(P)-dependent oxidoreductase [Treponema sp.]